MADAVIGFGWLLSGLDGMGLVELMDWSELARERTKVGGNG